MNVPIQSVNVVQIIKKMIIIMLARMKKVLNLENASLIVTVVIIAKRLVLNNLKLSMIRAHVRYDIEGV